MLDKYILFIGAPGCHCYTFTLVDAKAAPARVDGMPRRRSRVASFSLDAGTTARSTCAGVSLSGVVTIACKRAPVVIDVPGAIVGNDLIRRACSACSENEERCDVIGQFRCYAGQECEPVEIEWLPINVGFLDEIGPSALVV